MSEPARTHASCLAGGGAAGARLRAVDWSDNPLGPVTGWPMALQTAVRIVLNSAFPMMLHWGPELITVYNDAYAPSLGRKHPGSLGRPAREWWSEIWDQLDPIFARVLAGEAYAVEDARYTPDRDGAPREAYFTHCHSPLWDDEGRIAGIFLVVTETTRRVTAERDLTRANASLAAQVEAGRATERRQHYLLQQMPGFVCVLTGPEHVYAYVNDAYVAITGPRDFIGRRVRDALPEVAGQGFLELLDQVYATGEPVTAKGVPLRLAGEEAERFIDYLYHPIRDEGGSVTGIFVGGYDVTERVRSQVALAESEIRYRTLFESIDVGFCIVEMKFDAAGRAVDYRIVEANPAFERQTGAKVAGLWVSAFAPNLERHWFDTYGRVALTGEPAHFENRADVFGRWFDVRALRIGDPAAHRVAIFFSDISERKNMEEALRRLNTSLEQQVAERTRERNRVWQVSRDMLLVSDGAGVWLSVNPSWTRVLGWGAEELIGRTSEWLEHPDDRARTRAEVAKLAEGATTLAFENRFRARDGSYRTLNWTAVPVEGAIYAVARDVTDERAQAAVLAERTTERDRLWSMPNLLLAIAASDMTLVAVNPGWTALLGWPEAEIVGRSYADLVHPDDARRPLDRAAREEAGELVNLCRCRDGTYRAIAWTITPGDGVFHCVGRDVTAEREQAAALAQAEEAMRQSQKMEAVGQLTGGVAHDFNNLLTIIRSSVDFLRRPDLPELRKTRYLDAVSDTVDRAAKLTGQLLAFARRQALKPEVFDVGQKVRGIADMLDTVTGARVRMVTETPDEPCFIRADLSQFETALVNMAVNARDAMNEEGTLTLRLTCGAAMPPIRGHAGSRGIFAAVSLTDTGAGIAPDQLTRIFEPFYTTKEVGKGTGLGLSQVFGFAKQSGGDIDVASVPGRGSTFTLYLPEVLAEPRREGDEDARSLAPIGVGQRVLVVEDNVEVGRFATQLLEDFGYRTVWAANAEEALDRLGADGGGFDVVFSDVVMPGMGGIALATELRRRLPGLPVVLASGYSHVLAQDDTHGFELLHKPYSAEQLSRVLGRVTAQTAARRTARAGVERAVEAGEPDF